MNKEKKDKIKIVSAHIDTALCYIFCTVSVLCIIGLATGVVGMGPISGTSSYPTSTAGDFVISVSFLDYDRGDFVDIFDWYGDTKKECINKRIVGLPGETVEIIDDVVYINGQPLDEPYKYTEGEGLIGTTWPAITLGEDEYFVMGDNRRASVDSRSLGPVKAKYIKQTTVFILGDWKIKYNYFDKD